MNWKCIPFSIVEKEVILSLKMMVKKSSQHPFRPQLFSSPPGLQGPFFSSSGKIERKKKERKKHSNPQVKMNKLKWILV
jgi:hypothetical protein